MTYYGDIPSKMKMKRCYSIKAGFSLLEMTLVLVILALLLGGIVLPLSTHYLNLKRSQQAQRELEHIREALLGYAMTTGALPTPVNAAGTNLACSTANSGDICTGFVPWLALGTRKLDPWQKLYGYSVTGRFTDAGFVKFSGLNNTLGKVLVQERDENNAYNLRNLATNTVAIVYSHGQKNWGYNYAGTALGDGSSTNADEDTNASSASSGTAKTTASSTFIYRPYTDGTGESGGEYDDILVWISPYVFFNRMVQAQQLP